MNKLLKQCSKCKLRKAVPCFGKNIKSLDGLQNECRDCRKVRSSAYYANHASIIKAKTKGTSKEAKIKWAKQNKEYYKNYYQNNKIKWKRDGLEARFKYYQNNAKKRNFIFELSITQFDNLTKALCYYCSQFSQNKNFCGIDRIDNVLGYTYINSVPCCNICNKMKSNLEQSMFIEHIAKIHLTMNKKIYE